MRGRESERDEFIKKKHSRPTTISVVSSFPKFKSILVVSFPDTDFWVQSFLIDSKVLRILCQESLKLLHVSSLAD